jgi:hypothetical protein
MTFVSYRKTQIKDRECKKFCKFWKDWTEKKAYNILSHQSKNISTYYRKHLAPLSKGGDLCIYYIIKFNMYTWCNVYPFHSTILFINMERHSNISINSQLFIVCSHTIGQLVCLYRWKIICLYIKNHLYNHLCKLGVMDLCI